MKSINKAIIWALLIILTVFISCSIAVALFGKKIVISRIEENLKTKASLGGISLGLPFTLNLTNLEVGNLFKAERISANPDILGFLAGKTVLNRLVIKNGEFIFSDKKLSPEGFKIIIGNINAYFSKVMLPYAALNTELKLYANIMDVNARIIGGVDALGWIDFGAKDMDATLQIKNLDVTYFAPYYGDFISNRKLLSAKLNLTSLLKATNNDLTIASSLKLSDLVYAKEEPPREGEPAAPDLVKNTLELFSDAKGNLSLDFSINTKLDNPGISISEFKRAILNAAVKNLSHQPPEALIEKVTNTLGQFKDFRKELKNIFKKKE